MKFYLPLIVSVVLFFTGCTGKNPARLWFYTHSIQNSSRNDTLLRQTSFINLKPDGTYTRDFAEFDYGRWTLKDKEFELNNAGKITKLPVKYLGSEEMQLITAKDIVANFEAQPDKFKSEQEDPFSLVNNKWRVKATRKETEDEIKLRLRNHCQFWIAYFSWANNNRLAIVDVRSTPTLIKIYGNGFGLKQYSELPAVWRSYFFDDEDCKIANNLMYEIFQFKEISWAHTDNRYKMFIGAFQQLQQFLQ